METLRVVDRRPKNDAMTLFGDGVSTPAERSRALEQRLMLGVRLLVALEEEALSLEPFFNELNGVLRECREADRDLAGQVERFQEMLDETVGQIARERTNAEEAVYGIIERVAAVERKLEPAIERVRLRADEIASQRAAIDRLVGDGPEGLRMAPRTDATVEQRDADSRVRRLEHELRSLCRKLDIDPAALLDDQDRPNDLN